MLFCETDAIQTSRGSRGDAAAAAGDAAAAMPAPSTLPVKNRRRLRALWIFMKEISSI
jgi:hypothetical protein